MGDTNFVSGVVKILETPKQKVINKNIVVSCFRVQFPQVRNNSIVHLTFWGNLARDVVNYYKINDYVLIEGYLSVNNKNDQNQKNKFLKKMDITVLRTYPFLLNYAR